MTDPPPPQASPADAPPSNGKKPPAGGKPSPKKGNKPREEKEQVPIEELYDLTKPITRVSHVVLIANNDNRNECFSRRIFVSCSLTFFYPADP